MSIKLKGSSDGSVSFDAPADTSPSGSDITLTLPTSAGSANQFLKNSGIAGELEHSSMVETSTGIGIGTSAPQTSLEIKGANTTGKGQLLVSSASAGQEARMTFIDGSDDIAEISTDGDNLYFYNERSSGAFQFYTGGSERARLDSSGRLLVGTSSASTLRTNIIPKIQTEATSATENGISLFTNVNSSSGPFLIFGKSRGTAAGSNTVVQNNDDLGSLLFVGADGTDRASFGASIAAAVDGTPGSNDMPGRLVFSTTADGASSPTERALLTSAGRFKVTNTAGSGSTYYTNVNFSTFHTNTGGNIILGLENSASSDPYGVAMNFSDAAPDNNSNYFLYCTDESAVRCVIYSDGDIQNHDNSYSAISDVKLKQDIVDAGSQWEDLKNLRVRKFKFKSDVTAYGDDAKTLIGLVAQEAETVSPGLVADNPDKDSANNDLGTTTKSIRYSVLYMKAVKALQEAQTRIETLESQHAVLLARVTALEAA